MCNYRQCLSLSFALSPSFLSSVCLLVIMRRGGPQLDVKAHYEVNASGCEAQLSGSETEPFVFKSSAAKPGIIISSSTPPQPRPRLSLLLAPTSWLATN